MSSYSAHQPAALTPLTPTQPHSALCCHADQTTIIGPHFVNAFFLFQTVPCESTMKTHRSVLEPSSTSFHPFPPDPPPPQPGKLVVLSTPWGFILVLYSTVQEMRIARRARPRSSSAPPPLQPHPPRPARPAQQLPPVRLTSSAL